MGEDASHTLSLVCSAQAQLDAASATSSYQLAFAAAPGGEEVAELQLLAPELQGPGPPGVPSAALLPLVANGSEVALLGRVGAVSQRHADSNGSSVLNVTLTGLPTNY